MGLQLACLKSFMIRKAETSWIELALKSKMSWIDDTKHAYTSKDGSPATMKVENIESLESVP